MEPRDDLVALTGWGQEGDKVKKMKRRGLTVYLTKAR